MSAPVHPFEQKHILVLIDQRSSACSTLSETIQTFKSNQSLPNVERRMLSNLEELCSVMEEKRR